MRVLSFPLQDAVQNVRGEILRTINDASVHVRELLVSKTVFLSEIGNIRMEIKRSINDIPAHLWDEASQEFPFTQSRLLRFLEYIMREYEPRYILIWKNEKLIAGAVCHLQRHINNSGSLKRGWASQIVSLSCRRFPPLICSTSIYCFPGLFIAPSIDRNIGYSIIKRAIRITAQKELSLFWGINGLDLYLADRVPFASDMIQMSLPDECLLNIEWDTVSDYEASLPRKKRAEIRRLRNRSVESGVTLRIGELKIEHEQRVETLVRNVAEKHGNRYKYKPRLVQNALKILQPGDYSFLQAYLNNEMIGCLLLLRNNGIMLLKWIGLDYEKSEPTFAYHYMMTQTVHHAIELKMRHVMLGLTSYTLKKKMGGVLAPRFSTLQLTPPLLGPIAKQIKSLP